MPTGLIGIGLAVAAVLVALVLLRAAPASSRLPFARLRGVRGWHAVADVAGTDCVVVTPRAVLAVVTEHGDASAAPALEADLAAAEQAAHRVRELVRAAPTSDVAVVPVVWRAGAQPASTPAHELTGGVHVVDGRDPSGWMHLFREPRLDGRTRYELAAALERRAATEAGRRHPRGSVGLLPPPEPAGA